MDELAQNSPPPLPLSEWYYEDDGQRKGPFSEAVMKEQIETGKLTYGSMVWKKGLPDWIKIEDTAFKSYLLECTVPPPLHGEMVNNTVVWVLAFAPIFGYLLQCFVTGLIYHSDPFVDVSTAQNYWYITLILNIVLSYYDERRLHAAGHDTSKFKGFVWLVPVYLYQRAKYLKQNLAYFIAWIVCFVVMLLN